MSTIDQETAVSLLIRAACELQERSEWDMNDPLAQEIGTFIDKVNPTL